jgi:hypothetical protein
LKMLVILGRTCHKIPKFGIGSTFPDTRINIYILFYKLLKKKYTTK